MREPSILFEELTRDQLRRIASEAVVILPVGATEQHGPHLPVGTDALHVEQVARRAAAIAVTQIPLVVAPTLPFGSSHHHLPFGGTISLSTQTLYAVLWDMTESLVASGFRRLFIVNGHGGNHEMISLVVRDLALRHDVDAAAASWWLLAWDVLVAERAHASGHLPGHAGAFETSLLLALRPELVSNDRPHRNEVTSTDPTRFGDLVRTERHGFWQSIDGYTDSPDLGDAEAGARYLDVASTELAARLVAFATESARGRSEP